MTQDAPPPPPAPGAADPPRRAAFRRLRELWSVPTYRFACVFIALLVGMGLAYPALRLRYGHAFQAFEAFTARLVFAIVSRIAPDEALLKEPNIVMLGRFPVAVIDECTGVYEAVLLGAALLAFPTAWSRTALGFLLGFPAIYAMNLLRIVGLLFVGRYLPRSFEFMHVYFWQVTMIAMVATVWLAWVLWVVRADEPGAAEAGASPDPEAEKDRG